MALLIRILKVSGPQHNPIQYPIQYLLGVIMGDPAHDKVMRRRPETQGCSGYKGPSRLTPASTQPCSLFLLLLSLFALLQIFALPAESSPATLSLNKGQHRTLINKSPGRWFPMKGPEMKEMFQVKNPFAGTLACLANAY